MKRNNCSLVLFTKGSTLVCLLVLSGWSSPAYSQTTFKLKSPPLTDILPLLDASSPQALSGVLRGALIQFLPNPLYEASPGWGQQSMVANQLKWKRDEGILLKPKIYKTLKNDGTWRKIILTSNNLPDTLILDIRNVQLAQPNQLNFDLFLSFDARVEYLHHVWESGVRLYSGSVKARFRVKLLLHCEATATLESGKKLIPDAVFRLHATSGKLSFDNLVFEHVPGLGGSAAKVLGNGFHNILNDLRPSLESNLLSKGNAAIVKSADTKEVRVSLGRVFEKILKTTN